MSVDNPSVHEQHDQPSNKWLTMRVLLATVCAVLGTVCGRVYLDNYLHLNLAFIKQLPFATFLYVFIIACVWNPIFARYYKAAVFNTTELLATLLLSLSMVWGSGLVISHQMIAPQQLAHGELSWEKYQLPQQIPPDLQPLGGDPTHPDYEDVYVNYAQGLSPHDTIPWQHWYAPLALIIISLSYLVHRQWSRHEQLNYPIAQIAQNVFLRDQQRRLPDIFYSPLMWIAAGTVLFIHCYGMINTWFPEALPPLQFKGRFNFLWAFFPILNRTGAFWLVDFHLMFSVIGLAYFLGREVGITLGLSQVLLLVFAIQYYLNTGSVVSSSHIEMSRAGAYIAYGIIILITGRHYYLALLKRAFGKQSELAGEESVWIVRVFLLCNALLLVYLITVFQMDALLACLLILTLLVVAMVFARLVCEVGGPYIQGQWSIGNLLVAALGPTAIGPASLMAILYVCQSLSVSGNNALMPFVSNGLQIADKGRFQKKRLFTALLLCVVVTVCAGSLYKIAYFYQQGAQTKYGDASGFAAVKNTFTPAVRAMEKVDEFGQMEVATTSSGISKIPLIAPDWSASKWILFGAAGVLVFFLMRIRFTWFPFHPILFLVWDTFPMQIFYWSFFIGWCCKEMVIRFGGGNIYQKAKPFFIGLIIGDILAFGLSALTSITYFLATGADPEVYRVFIFY